MQVNKGLSKVFSEFYLDYTIAGIQEMHREAAELIKADWSENRFLLGCYETHATPAEIKKLKTQLMKVLGTFHARHRKPQKGTRPLGITFGLVPSNAAGWSSSQRVFDMLA